MKPLILNKYKSSSHILVVPEETIKEKKLKKGDCFFVVKNNDDTKIIYKKIRYEND